jgi:hypothetical protein
MQHAAEPDERRRGFRGDVEACRAVRPSVFRVARAMRSDPDPAIASAALGTALACLLDAPELAHHRAETAAWSGGHALAGLDTYSRVMAVLTLQTWGCDTTSAMPAAIERASLDDLIPALDLLLAHPPAVIYHGGWGAQLRAKAFPDGFPPVGPLTAAQQALRAMIAERCFSPDSPPIHFSDDARRTLSDLVP